MTAEADRVAVEAVSFGEMADGRKYGNTYHMLFTPARRQDRQRPRIPSIRSKYRSSTGAMTFPAIRPAAYSQGFTEWNGSHRRRPVSMQ